MPSIVGKYEHYKNEGIEEEHYDEDRYYGIPYLGRKTPVFMEISLDGEQMTVKNSSPEITIEWDFKLGEVYNEYMPSTAIKCITTLINDHEMETKSVFKESGVKCGRHYEFTDEGCVVTLLHEYITTNPAKRYYKRIN